MKLCTVQDKSVSVMVAEIVSVSINAKYALGGWDNTSHVYSLYIGLITKY
jgi:hypothetical protein